MTITTLIDLVSRGGLISILMLILYGSYKGTWVWGSRLREVESERDEWKEAAMTGTHGMDTLADFAVHAGSRKTNATIRTGRREIIAEHANEPLARRKAAPK